MKRWIYLAVFLMLIEISSATRLYGSVYDFSLNRQKNAIVEINSTPRQLVVAADGDYSFELPLGSYEIKARYVVFNETQSSVAEAIDIRKEGSFRLDLILFPSFEAEEEILEETSFEVEDIEEKSYNRYMIIGVFIFALIIFLIYKYKDRLVKRLVKHKDEIEIDEEKDIISFIKKHGRRITQKDIRKNFPSSEAKISLILTDLEDKGIIKKIKKGRGNIIILK
jgi:uncharacterized membrane protein